MAKSALITGASTGIGRELARILATHGFDLVLVARNQTKLEELARELSTNGKTTARAVVADLAQPNGPQTVFQALGGATPDVLINNAGWGMLGPFADQTLSTHLDMIQVNVSSLVALTHLILPGMRQRGSGRILNVASTAAFQPGPLMAIYYATKSFVLHFSEAIAVELRGTGITVTTLCPGPTDTEFQSRAKLGSARLFSGGMKVMSAREVAEIGYRAMMKGKTLAIAGFRNRLGMEALRLAPRSIVRRMVYNLHR